LGRKFVGKVRSSSVSVRNLTYEREGNQKRSVSFSGFPAVRPLPQTRNDPEPGARTERFRSRTPERGGPGGKGTPGTPPGTGSGFPGARKGGFRGGPEKGLKPPFPPGSPRKTPPRGYGGGYPVGSRFPF